MGGQTKGLSNKSTPALLGLSPHNPGRKPCYWLEKRLVQTWVVRIKGQQWWNSKVAPAVGLIYWLWSQSQEPITIAVWLPQLALFLASYIGLGALGHLLNDYFDRDQDSRCGLRNFFHSASLFEKIAAPLTFVCLALLPWTVLSLGCLKLAILEIVLLWIYSAPPVRAKERGRWAHFLDGLYGYVLPLSLPWFWLGGGLGTDWACLAAWASVMGIGQNLLHQILDFENDQRAGTSTFVVQNGWRKSWKELRFCWTPLEILLLVVLLLQISKPAVFALALYTVLAGLRHAGECLCWRQDLARFAQLDLLNWFVVGWLPLLALVGLVWRQPQFWPLVPFHYFAFANGVRGWVRYRRW